jgi:hypothetical protein
MARRYFIKHLRLVTPEGSGKVGIPSEAPTFVAPMVEAGRSCPVCTVTYTPLLYQTGYITEAHHFHDTSGGIGHLRRALVHSWAGLYPSSGSASMRG